MRSVLITGIRFFPEFHHIRQLAVKSATYTVDGGGFYGFIMAKSIYCIAVNTICIYQRVCSNPFFLQVFPERFVCDQFPATISIFMNSPQELHRDFSNIVGLNMIGIPAIFI